MATDFRNLSKLIAPIAEKYGVERVYLFGSRARGDARPDSDWDVLVLLDKEKITSDDHDNISYSLFDLGLDYKELVNTVLFTKKDWQDNRIAVFRHNVLEDAIPL